MCEKLMFLYVDYCVRCPVHVDQKFRKKKLIITVAASPCFAKCAHLSVHWTCH